MPSIDPFLVEQFASCLPGLRLGNYSDFSIRCSDGTIIRAHRAIVCPRSPVLPAAVDGKFQEAVSKEIYLEDDEPLIVAKMIDFLYGFDYDDQRSEERASVNGNDKPAPPPFKFKFGDNPDEIPTKYKSAATDQPAGHNAYALLINAKAYVIADKYDVQALREWAVKKYKEVLPTTWNSTAFVESARFICDNTLDNDRVLREVIIENASEDIKALFDRGEFVDLLQSHGDFATEVLRRVVFDSESRQGAQAATDDYFFSHFTSKKDKKKRDKRG